MLEERPIAIQLSGYLPFALQSRYRQVLGALDDLTVGEQLEIATQVVVGILAVARVRAEGSQSDRGDFDRLCGAVEEWLEVRVAALRRSFT